ncbi:MAG: hypothetical protein K2K64_01380, partial [Muribaculaceae bacterium]|nr:hypothetical protein [Muribaculaceae bacterium]
MKRMLLILLVGICLAVNPVYADRHGDRGKHNERREHRDNRGRHKDHGKGKGHDKKDYGHKSKDKSYNKHRNPGHSAPPPGIQRPHPRPVPPPPPPHKHK